MEDGQYGRGNWKVVFVKNEICTESATYLHDRWQLSWDLNKFYFKWQKWLLPLAYISS